MTDRPAPKSANEVLANLREDHDWKLDPADLTSTGGLQRNITALWAAVQALADYVDGVATGKTDDYGKPIKASSPAAGVSPGVLNPAGSPSKSSRGASA